MSTRRDVLISTTRSERVPVISMMFALVLTGIVALTACSAPGAAVSGAAELSTAAERNPADGKESGPAQAGSTERVVPSDVESAKGAAVQALSEAYGFKCLMVGNGLRHYPSDYADRLDEQIAEAQVGAEGWVTEGKIWIGTAESAAEAFGAVSAFIDHHSAWVIRESTRGVRANELVAITSSSGKTSWRLGDQIAECDSTDPSSDDDEGDG